MTAPMVAWMRFRGHNWRQTGEMTAAMLVPVAILVAVGLPELACPAMTLGMLAQMLYRRDKYLQGSCHKVSQRHGARH